MVTDDIPVRTHKRALRSFDPFEAFERLRWPWLGSLALTEPWAPTADVFVKGGKLVVEMDLPGMKKEDIEVTLEGGDLVLEGKREQDKEVSTEDYYRMERARGMFRRRIGLPFEVDVRNVQARFEGGVLHIEIPRPPEETPRPQKVRVH